MTYKPKYFNPLIVDDSTTINRPGVTYAESINYADDAKPKETPKNPNWEDIIDILRNYRYNSEVPTADDPLDYSPEDILADAIDQPVNPESEVSESEYPESIESISMNNDKFKSKDDFLTKMTYIYKKVLKEKGINEDFAVYLVAQDALESGWGAIPSGRFNYGGIKGPGTVKTTREYKNGEYVTEEHSFRDFENEEAYVRHKIATLKNNYEVFSHPANEFVYWVQKGGYATSPEYMSSFNGVLASFKQGGKISRLSELARRSYFKQGGTLMSPQDIRKIMESQGWVSDNSFRFF